MARLGSAIPVVEGDEAVNGRLVVGVTQRIVMDPDRAERRDCLDQAWVRFLDACDADVLPIPNTLTDPITYLRRFGVAAVILSGGGDVSRQLRTTAGRPPALPVGIDGSQPERDLIESALLEHSSEIGWPLIGVCRGMQAVNLHHGGRLAPIDGHAGTRHPLDRNVTELKSANQPELPAEVNSFHGLAVPHDGVGIGLTVLASYGPSVEALVHRDHPQLAVMWHPERQVPPAPADVALFSRFLHRGAL